MTRGGAGAATLEGIGDRLDRASASYETNARPFIVLLFLLTVIMPVFFFIGPVRLTTMRLFLMIMMVPLIIRLATGRNGGVQIVDLLIIAYPLWTILAMTLNGQIGRWINLLVGEGIDIIGAYLIARVYIRDISSFLYFVRCFLWILLFLVPFAAFESLTRTMPLSIVMDMIPGLNVLPNVNYEPRLGLFRAQTVFAHPILYGVFCSAGVGLAWAALAADGADNMRRGFWTAVSFAAGFFSLSTGALLAMMTQFMLFAWEAATWMVEKRWRILLLLTAVFYVTIDMLSNRTPVTIFISIATFNTGSAWNRVLIWEYGSASVWRNPVLGIGFRWWERPLWMKGSVDNFWLLIAMRYGIPAFLLIAGAVLANVLKIGKMAFAEGSPHHACQRGYLIALISMSIALCTVHIWGDILAFVMFFIGAGVWMYSSDIDTTGNVADAPVPDEDGRRASRVRRSSGPTRTDPDHPRRRRERIDPMGRDLPTSRPPLERKAPDTGPGYSRPPRKRD